MSHFPHYMTVLINRESRIAGVRAFSKRLCELPTQPSVKIFGERYALTTVIVRQILMKGVNDPSDSDPQPIIHYYTYTRNLRSGEWFGFFNGIVAKVEVA